jgi:hypothetical protein
MCGSVVQHLPDMHEAQSSIPGAIKNKNKTPQVFASFPWLHGENQLVCVYVGDRERKERRL